MLKNERGRNNEEIKLSYKKKKKKEDGDGDENFNRNLKESLIANLAVFPSNLF